MARQAGSRARPTGGSRRRRNVSLDAADSAPARRLLAASRRRRPWRRVSHRLGGPPRALRALRARSRRRCRRAHALHDLPHPQAQHGPPEKARSACRNRFAALDRCRPRRSAPKPEGHARSGQTGQHGWLPDGLRDALPDRRPGSQTTPGGGPALKLAGGLTLQRRAQFAAALQQRLLGRGGLHPRRATRWRWVRHRSPLSSAPVASEGGPPGATAAQAAASC